MSMRASSPDEIEFTLSIRMPLADWKRLKEQLDTLKWPAMDISHSISDMITQAQTQWWPRDSEEP